MDEFLIDTDVWVDLARKHPHAISFFEHLPADAAIYLSVITKMELIAGCRNKAEQRKVEHLLKDFSLLPIRAEDSLLAGDLYARYRLTHGVGILDCLIASTALGRKIVLFTKNEKHFAIFPGVTVRKPY